MGLLVAPVLRFPIGDQSLSQVPRPTCFCFFQKWVGEPGYRSPGWFPLDLFSLLLPVLLSSYARLYGSVNTKKQQMRNNQLTSISLFCRGNTITVNVVDRWKDVVPKKNFWLLWKRCGACTKGWFDLGGPAWRALTGGELPGHIRGVKSRWAPWAEGSCEVPGS